MRSDIWPKFTLGRSVVTPGAERALMDSEENCYWFLARHMIGDWGDLDPEDVQTNEDAVKCGLRILSAYKTSKGVKIWVITESDRSVTTILLPEEY